MFADAPGVEAMLEGIVVAGRGTGAAGGRHRGWRLVVSG
jgi:hypothetical protein